MLILRGIEQKGFVRFNETKRVLSASGRILQTHLRELEGDGLIQRIDYPGYPRRTDYVFTEVGKTLIPIINSIYKWNIKRMKEQQIPITTETSIYHQDID